MKLGPCDLVILSLCFRCEYSILLRCPSTSQPQITEAGGGEVDASTTASLYGPDSVLTTNGRSDPFGGLSVVIPDGGVAPVAVEIALGLVGLGDTWGAQGVTAQSCGPGRRPERTDDGVGGGACAPCPVGSFAAEAGLAPCTVCPEGFATDGDGATACTFCMFGYGRVGDNECEVGSPCHVI